MLTYRGITSQILLEEAEKMGFEVNVLQKNKNFFTITGNGKKVYFKSNDFGGNSSLGSKIAEDKELCNIFLEKNNFKIPKTVYLNQGEAFSLKESGLQFPLVTKPLGEGHGNGVLAGIVSEKMLNYGIQEAFNYGDRVIIQEFIEGDEHRILVIGDRVVLGIKRIPAHVFGDGISTIEVLIDEENKNPLRGVGYETALSYIDKNEKMSSYLAYQGLALNHVPNQGEKIILRSVSNLGAGGIMEEVTDKISDDIKQECIRLAKKSGLVVVGIDIIIKDISKSLVDGGGAIIEINATPGFGGDRECTSVNTGKELLKYVFNL